MCRYLHWKQLNKGYFRWRKEKNINRNVVAHKSFTSLFRLTYYWIRFNNCSKFDKIFKWNGSSREDNYLNNPSAFFRNFSVIWQTIFNGWWEHHLQWQRQRLNRILCSFTNASPCSLKSDRSLHETHE